MFLAKSLCKAMTRAPRCVFASSTISRFHCNDLLQPSLVSVRCFHNSMVYMAPKGKKADKSDKAAEGVPLPDVKVTEAQMDKSIQYLVIEFDKIKVARATADTFNNIVVESFGTLADAAQITMKGPTRVSLSVYDESMVKAVADAIKGSGLGVNPTVEGNEVLVNLPKPSKESRDLMVKAANKLGEKVKGDIRQARKEAMDALKKCKGSSSDDEIKRKTKEIDTVSEKKTDRVSQLLKDKEKDLMA